MNSASSPAVFCACGEEWSYAYLYSLARVSDVIPITLDDASRATLALEGFFFGRNLSILKSCQSCNGLPPHHD